MLRNYVKLALKVLARRKFFTFVSLFAISFTLLVLLVATAFLDHAFSGSSPESKIGRTIGIYRVAMFGPNNVQMGAAGYRVYDQFIRRADGLEATAIAETQHKVPSFLGGRKVESWMKHTDAGYWRIFDFQFVEGGPFTAVDDAQAAHVAVINEATRQRFFGGAPAVGKTIEADGQRFRVVGVVRNVSFLRFLSFSDIWVPLSTERSSSYRQELMGRFYALGLLRDASDRGRVQAEIRAATGRAQLPDPKNYDRLVAPADDRFNGIARILLPGASMGDRPGALLGGILFALAAVFMTLPTLNLVNINLSRIMERASEIAVRKAFGASRLALVGQFLVENIVLTLVGGAIGLLLASGVLSWLNASGTIPYADLHLNWRIFGWSMLIAVVFGALSGVYPAWRMSRMHPASALRGR